MARKIEYNGGWAYIPKGGINEDTKFLFTVYCHEHPFQSYDDNVVVIYNNSINGFAPENQAKINGMMQQIAQIEGLSYVPKIDAYAGFSQGCQGALMYGITSIDENTPPRTIILFDPNDSNPLNNHDDGGFADATWLLRPENAEYLQKVKDNRTTIIGLEKLGEANNQVMRDNYARLAKQGIPVMLCVRDTYDHVEVYTESMVNITGLLSGDEDKAQALLNQCQGIYVWDESLGTDGGWKQITSTDGVLEFSRVNIYSSLANLDEKVVCDDEEIKSKLIEIRKTIKKTSFLTDTFTYDGTSTSQIPSLEAEDMKTVTDAIAKVYQKLAHDTEEIAFMCQIYKMEDNEFAKYANEINSALKAAQETTSNSNGSSGYYTGGGYSGNYGGYGSGGPALEPSTDNDNNENNKDDENKDYDSKNDSNKDNENKGDENNKDLSAITTAEFDDYWPDYDNLVSDEDKLVYNCDDEFKLIIHTDGEEVTGLEHMFKFASKDEALEGLEKIKQDYKDVDNVDKIILNDNFIKVLFNKLAFKDLTREDAKAMYEHLGEITKDGSN